LRPTLAILSDLNSELIATYRAIKRRPLPVFECFNEMPTHAEFYYSLRNADPAGMSHEARAARFLYLNRYCFNGVYRTNRQGRFNVPRGVKTGRPPSAADLMACSCCLAGATLLSGDFYRVILRAKAADFVYLDPPYPSSSRPTHGEYGYGTFAASDLPRLLDGLRILDSVGAKFLLSYIDFPDVARLFRRWRVERVLTLKHVSGFARHRSAISELLVSNYRRPRG
jgi:DNA adenine methylase